MSTVADAQDIHFSQFFNQTTSLNPANTGFFKQGDYRLGNNQRNQWFSVPVPYFSNSFAADAKVKNFTKYKSILSIGGQFDYDKSGDGNYKTVLGKITAAYNIRLKEDSSAFLSFGLGIGINTQSFNPNNLSFDNQYNGDLYNQGASNGESFYTTKIHIPVTNFGLAFNKTFKNNSNLQLGQALFYGPSFKQSFFNDPLQKLDKKIITTVQYAYVFSPVSILITDNIIAFQGKNFEMLNGIRYKHILKPVNNNKMAAYVGVYNRLKDAAIFYLGFDHNNLSIGLNYDYNYSGLKVASNKMGAWEWSLIYRFYKARQVIPKHSVCPVFL